MENRLNLQKLLDDHSIEYREGNSGWIQLHCPFCYKNDGVFGLGFNRGFTCFKCGKLRVWEVIAGLLGTNLVESRRICDKYREHIKSLPSYPNPIQRKTTAVSTVRLPYGTAPMTKRHRNYLKQRNFDPEQLESEWGLLGTGPVGESKYRIIVPIMDVDGKMVCYQGRDITDKASIKYKSCPDNEAVVPIKQCLYGLEKCQKDWIIITEGVTKVWWFGPGIAVATFGTAVTETQLLALKQFKKRFIFFDGDEAGIQGAEKLAANLRVFSGETIIMSSPDIIDIAELSHREVSFTAHKEMINDIQNKT